MAATRINVQAITDRINNANKQLSDQETTLGDIDKTINTMEGVWEAEDQRVYAERFRSRKQKIDNFNRSVAESLKAIQTYVDDCVSADDQTGRDLRNVSW